MRTRPMTLALAALLALTGSAHADGSGPETSVAVTPETVWNLADSASSPDAIKPVLEPEKWRGTGATPGLLDSLTLLQSNLEKREQRRSEEIEETRTELDEHLDAFEQDDNPVELSDALASAVTLQMLMGDDDAFFGDPKIRDLIETGEREARAAEERGDWVISSELYFRLDTLHENERVYKDDVDRLSRRLAMIRLYAPERLWELRNERRSPRAARNSRLTTPTATASRTSSRGSPP